MIPPPSHNPVGACNQKTLLTPYYISSRMVNLFKVTDTIIKVSDIHVLTVSFKFINFSFQIFVLFVLECLLVSHLHCSDYLHYFGLDPVATASYPASFDLKVVNIHHQTLVYVASIHIDLRFSLAEILCNVFPSHIYVLAIIIMSPNLQTCSRS